MTLSSDEIVKFDERTQALLEGRVIYDPDTDEYMSTTSHVVKEWQEVLKSPKVAGWSRRDVLDTQKRFFEAVRKRDLYKDKTDEEFKRDVSNPIFDATFDDKRFKSDEEVELGLHLAFGFG